MPAPIEAEYREMMNALARALDDVLNPSGIKTVGFALLIFELGEATDKSRVNYICNADRADMLVAMKEFIARAEGRYVEEPGPQ
jgi:hypothetical protein